MFSLAALNAAVKLHASLLHNVMHLPMQFFNVTPLGRLLGRFSNDMNSVDNYLQYIFKGAFACMISVRITSFLFTQIRNT